MEITLTDSLGLTAVLALLILGYINRRVATAQATRGLIKDHIKGTRHHKQDKTMIVLRQRLSLQAGMLTFSACGAISAILAATCTVLEQDSIAKIVFVAGLTFALISLVQAVREAAIANRSHFTELDMIISKDDPYYNTPAA